MKERSKINPRDPTNSLTSSLRDFHGVRSSDNRFDVGKAKRVKFADPEIEQHPSCRMRASPLASEVAQAPRYVVKAKRVKFTDPETEQHPRCRTRASPTPYEAAQAPSSDAPKTSEYAFFRKLKRDAGCDNSYRLQKEDKQLNHFDTSGNMREIANKSKTSCGDLRSSLLFEKAGPANNCLFSSPLAGASKNSEATKVAKDCLKDIRSPLLARKVSSVNHCLLFSPLDASKNSDPQNLVKDVFSTRRERLLQWVADTSLPEVDKPSTKGCDLVSLLLSRLFPKGHENNCFRESKPRGAETETNNKVVSFPESDDKEFTWNLGRGFMEAKHGPYWNDFSAQYLSNESREVVLSRWDTVGYDSPRPHVQYKNRKTGYDYDSGRSANLITHNDPYFHSRFENHRSFVSSHLKELDKFPDVNESPLGRESNAFLLDWDGENVKFKEELSLAYPESDTYVKELEWTHRGDFMEAKLASDVKDFSSEFRSSRLGERILAGWDTAWSDSPSTSYATMHLLYGKKKHYCSFDSGRNAKSLIESNSYFHSRFGNYGSMALNHLEEFQYPNESALGREPHALLLGWESDNIKDGGELSVTTHNAEMNVHSTLATSWDGDMGSGDKIFDASELHPSSFSSNYPHRIVSVPHFCLADFYAHDFRRYLEDEKYLVTKLNPFPQTLSRTLKFHNLLGGCETDSPVEVGSMFLSPQNHQWFDQKVSSEKHASGMETLLSSGLDLDLGWKCFPETDSFREHYSTTCHNFKSPQKEGKCSYHLPEEVQESPYNSNRRGTIAEWARDPLDGHNWRSIKFPISLSKEMVYPLQLDSSSWVRPEEEMYYDRDEREYI